MLKLMPSCPLHITDQILPKPLTVLRGTQHATIPRIKEKPLQKQVL